MKKTLLFAALIASASLFAQQPTVINATLDPLTREGSSSACSCTGWMNKDLGDQLESSSWNSSTSYGAKFDDLEADIMYQEVAVLANTNYKFTYVYNFDDKATATEASSLEMRILKGSGYDSGYTPAYEDPANGKSIGFGYTLIASVENASNNLVSATIAHPGDKDYRTGELTFNSGDNTSIAIFGRGIGRPTTADADGKGYSWSNGSSEIRIDEVSLTNTGGIASVNDIFSSKISVYPNPAKNFIQITSNENITGVEMFNLIGKKVLSASSLTNDRIDTSKLSKGVYILKVTSNDLVGSRKVIIE
ncbi:MAG: T9SS type A sorting domain-containing protein [Polaribacter sp.]|nr:T9SS type A sorting domain-containing protein [Polaribacter sp.]